MTKTTLAALLVTLLTILPATATMAQDEDGALYGLVNDLGAAIVDVESELLAIDERQSSDEWMVFESASQGLVQVDLAEVGRWLPVVQTLRFSSTGGGIDSLASSMPELWQASTLLADAPDWVLELGPEATVTWLWEQYGHLQTPDMKRLLYDEYRAELLEKQTALRVAGEVFMYELAQTETIQTEPPAQTETLQVEEFCYEILQSEDGSRRVLGPGDPRPEDLPDWCRALVEPQPTPTAMPTSVPEDDCGLMNEYMRPDFTVTHSNWVGGWDQYGDDGIADLTLTQSGHCLDGTYDYEGWNLWLRLMVVGEHELEGYWYAGSPHSVTCDYERDGTTHWGPVALGFDEQFRRFTGSVGGCDSARAASLEDGERVR